MDFLQLKEMVNSSRNIVFFGGAGTSTESGIPDFRTNQQNIFLDEYLPEDILRHNFFYEYPEMFFAYYKSKLIHLDAAPNLGHIALVELEKRGQLKAIITQNIDGLHQLAGSQNVIELHGSVHRNYCIACSTFFSLEEVIQLTIPVPKCPNCSNIIKPGITLYDEEVSAEELEISRQYIRSADILIVAVELSKKVQFENSLIQNSRY